MSSPETLTIVSLGPGGTQIHEDDLHSKLAPFGLTKGGWTSLRRALGLPCIHYPSGDRFIDLLSFQLTMRAINRIGQPDFLMPGCKIRDRGNYDKSKYTQTLNIDYFYDNWKIFITEVLLEKKLERGKVSVDFVGSVERAASRIAFALAQLTAEEHEVSLNRRLAQGEKEGIFKLLSTHAT